MREPETKKDKTGGRIRADTAAWPPRNRQSLQHTTLGLVVLGSRDRRQLQESGASQRRRTTFPRRPAEVIVTGKAPRPKALPQRNGAGPGDEWLPRGSRVVPPEVVPGLREFEGQGAEPMSSSLAGPDCCGGLGNIDFRQVMFWLGRVGTGRGMLMATGFAGLPAPPPTPGGRVHRYQATG